MSEPDERIKRGSCVQINEQHGRLGWMGAFAFVEEVNSWGVLAFVHMIKTHNELPGFAYIRLKWNEIDYIGESALMPAGTGEPG